MTKTWTAALALLLALSGGCSRDKGDEKAPPQRGAAQAAPSGDADAYSANDPGLTPEQLEKGRLDTDWTAVVTVDTTGAGAPVANPEKWEQINAREINRTPVFLPLSGDVAGPSVLRVQILLDRAFFSPGIIDGRWGKNVAKAVYFFQQREGLRTTGRVDSLTWNRLARVGGQPDQLVVQHALTADDVKGPFVEIPDSVYEWAKLDCSCYETLSEKLGELFHSTPELLTKLNPGVKLDDLRAGQRIWVPAVRDPDSRAQGEVARLEVSGRGSFVHALDANGRILYHFPSTLGASYDPSPQGAFQVVNVTRDPWWLYQPALLKDIPDDRPEARIPPGPNNAVGVVWMSLSVPHYGIHGTKAPETIGYTTSSGCVRLTNWDVSFLATHVSKGTPVHFRDIQGRAGGEDSAGGSSRDSTKGAREAGDDRGGREKGGDDGAREKSGRSSGARGGRSSDDTTRAPRDSTR